METSNIIQSVAMWAWGGRRKCVH